MRIFNNVKNIKYNMARLFCRRPAAVRNSKVDPKAKIGDGAQLIGCVVGRYTYMYDCSAISAEIGSFCSIARGCIIGGAAHPTEWVSSSPVFYDEKNFLKTNFSINEFVKYKKTVIGNDVWIGNNCIIKGGIAIGDGAIIGMGSVVTHDVPPYEIWAGNPAHLIRKRFDDETIQQLSEIKWWDLSEEELQEIGYMFKNPKELVKHIKTSKS